MAALAFQNLAKSISSKPTLAVQLVHAQQPHDVILDAHPSQQAKSETNRPNEPTNQTHKLVEVFFLSFFHFRRINFFRLKNSTTTQLCRSRSTKHMSCYALARHSLMSQMHCEHQVNCLQFGGLANAHTPSTNEENESAFVSLMVLTVTLIPLPSMNG